MITKAGQRWQFSNSNYLFIVEIITPTPYGSKGIVKQSIKGFKKIDEHNNYTIFLDRADSAWIYLEGQDNPDA